MTRTSILSLVAMLLFASCSKKVETVKNDWYTDNLKGEVASFRISNYLASYDLGEVQASDLIGSEGRVVYNSRGYRTEEYWRFNDATSRKVYAYDEHDRCISLTCYNPSNELEELATFTYNPKGILEQEEGHRANGELFYRTEFIADSEGNIVEVLEYAPDGALEERTKSKYKNGLEVEQYSYIYDGDNALITQTIFSYNSQGLLHEASLLDDTRTLLNRWEYEYDKYHNITSEVCYDDEGALIEKRTYSYTYDSNNNWTERIMFEGEAKEPRIITRRSFSYF